MTASLPQWDGRINRMRSIPVSGRWSRATQSTGFIVAVARERLGSSQVVYA